MTAIWWLTLPPAFVAVTVMVASPGLTAVMARVPFAILAVATVGLLDLGSEKVRFCPVNTLFSETVLIVCPWSNATDVGAPALTVGAAGPLVCGTVTAI